WTGTKQLIRLLPGVGRVLLDVAEAARRHGDHDELHLRQEPGLLQRMAHVRLARLPELVPVGLLGRLVGAPEQPHIGLGVVREDPLDQLLKEPVLFGHDRRVDAVARFSHGYSSYRTKVKISRSPSLARPPSAASSIMKAKPTISPPSCSTR